MCCVCVDQTSSVPRRLGAYRRLARRSLRSHIPHRIRPFICARAKWVPNYVECYRLIKFLDSVETGASGSRLICQEGEKKAGNESEAEGRHRNYLDDTGLDTNTRGIGNGLAAVCTALNQESNKFYSLFFGAFYRKRVSDTISICNAKRVLLSKLKSIFRWCCSCVAEGVWPARPHPCL